MKKEELFTQEFLQRRLSQRQRHVMQGKLLTSSAVLVPIVYKPAGMELLFTKRTDTVEHHKGQISFPGGAADVADASPADTALRESSEEIGLDRSVVSILGMMDDLQTPSGFIVTPVVGFIETLPSLQININEVAEVIYIPIELFFDDSRRHSKIIELNGIKREVYFFDVWREPVWGATAFFVKQLVDVVRNPQ
jgi:8-oxo-dGTP pyrophosphatase MutT (NUDIX family)